MRLPRLLQHSIAPLILGTITLSVAGCAATKPADIDLHEVRRAIDAGNAAWATACRQQDGAALANVFLEDGVLLQPNGDIARGREAIGDLMQAGMDNVGPTEATVETEQLWAVDECVYETGSYTYAFTADGKPQAINGRYVVVWQRDDDGQWRISVDLGLPDK